MMDAGRGDAPVRAPCSFLWFASPCTVHDVISIAQIQHRDVLPELPRCEVFQQRPPSLMMDQEDDTLISNHDRRDGDHFCGSICEDRSQGTAGRSWDVICAQTVNEWHSIGAAYEEDADVLAEVGERHPESAKGFATATRAPRIWVVDLESATHESVLVIDLDAVEEVTRSVWDLDVDAHDVQTLTIRLRAFDDLQIVHVSRTATGKDAHEEGLTFSVAKGVTQHGARFFGDGEVDVNGSRGFHRYSRGRFTRSAVHGVPTRSSFINLWRHLRLDARFSFSFRRILQRRICSFARATSSGERPRDSPCSKHLMASS